MLGIWLIISAGLIVCELLTGTFYLLILALGCLVAALVAHFISIVQIQIVVAIVVALIGVWYLTRWRNQKKSTLDVSMDLGAESIVKHWVNGKARIHYRGTTWDARLAEGEAEDAMYYRVIQTDGNVLVLAAKMQKNKEIE